jgi:hypothetical protein
MTSLAFIQLKRKISPLPPPDPPNATSNERQMLSILNWIASFFVRNPVGDCVASALSVEGHKIILYLAANRGQPEEVDVQNGLKLVSALRQAFHDPQSASRLLFNSAISITYLRFYRKLDMIKNMRFPLRKIDSTTVVQPTEIFEKLMTKWAQADGVEQYQKLIDYAQIMPDLPTYESGGDGISTLKAFFKLFIEMIDSQRDLSDLQEKDRFLEVAWSGFCLTAILLVSSNFFSCVVTDDMKAAILFDADELNWLRKLRRRLWRIARYRIDAKSVATTGIKWIRRILGDEFTEGGDCFKVVWVGHDLDTLPENHGKKYEIKERPQELFNKLLGEYGFNVSTDKNEQTYMTDLGSLWPIPKPNFTPVFVPFLHCELQLIGYLDRHNVTVHMNLIGVSKLMCWACNAYVKEVNNRRKDDRKDPYVLSGASGKARHAWLIPPGEELRDVVVKIVSEALKAAISSLADKLGHQRIHSGGSDSSTGSSSPYSSDSDELEAMKALEKAKRRV